MRHSQLSLPPVELNRVGTASPTPPKSVGDWRSVVARAIGRAGLSHKEAAGHLDITQSALSKQLSGLEHLSFWRMVSLPRAFWSELIPLIREFHGLPPDGLIAEDLELIRIGKAYVELQGLVAARSQR